MKNQLIEKAPAKVNLSLGITGKQVDGYHTLEMVNHSIDLADELILTPSDHFEFKVNKRSLANRDNLVIKVIEFFSQLLNRPPEFKIELIKNIPENAGLAGGSSDAAAMIRLIDKYWNLNLPTKHLRSLALKVGADVPYCLTGGTAYIEGIGERVFPLKDFKPEAMLILNPDIKIKTPKAYQLVDEKTELFLPNSLEVIKAIEEHRYEDIKEYAGNSFTEPLSQEYPEIKKLIDKLYENGAYYATMSGSGATVVGYFNSVEQRNKAADSFKEINKFLI